MLIDTKALNTALQELENERGIPKDKTLDAIEHAFAAAYKKEYGKKGQFIKAKFNLETGELVFTQIKKVVSPESIYYPEDEISEKEKEEKIRFNPEQHILLDDAKKIKSGVQEGDEIEFPLETKEDFGRIAAQTAKQVIMQKIRAAERESTIDEYGSMVGQIVTGHVQRFERGNLYIDLGKAIAVLPRQGQIPGERYRQGERVRALLYEINPESKDAFIKLSRVKNEFLVELFKQEVPEMEQGIIEVKSVAREPGRRAKIAVSSLDERIDPVGSLVGQRGVRVSTVTSELGGEKIDIIEWSDDEAEFVARSISPAEALSVEIDEENKEATIEVSEDQESLAIGRDAQNVRLAAKLAGYKITIVSSRGDELASSDGENYLIKENGAEKAGVLEEELSEENNKTESSDKENGKGLEEEVDKTVDGQDVDNENVSPETKDNAEVNKEGD